MTFTMFRFASFFIAACTLAACASAQNGPETACPGAPAVTAGQLYGLWDARFAHPPAGLPDHATVRLQRHAEFSESLAGTVSRDLKSLALPAPGHAPQAALAGDLDEGLLLLDESSDKLSITGTWNGEPVAGSCGKVFRGLWKDTSPGAAPDAPGVDFTLTRRP